ncbi:3-oxoacyl-ACP reductase [Marmoricola endophyticus]|uniref:3-oxoacyl-ACP reductase n=1 Tax=Marmoricola endophyticus TaxID=2040280 RepID=A0A917BDZ9_9ACTN|nr:SDR family oxidoreductase [Marmoricola endophyticus]GGF39463.1 3-oxoacyl-ACP reductase [Marmoricola endophyticus]
MTHNSYAVSGKVVLVTGGGSGIGRAITRAFLDNGATVAVVGRRAEALEETLAGYDDDRALAVQGDLSTAAGVREVVETVVGKLGRLDVLVNNAATYSAQDITELSDEEWDGFRSTNIDAFVHLARAVLPELEKTGGNVVVTGSVSGMRGDWGQAAYNATKAAVMNLVQSLALDWGGRGVRLNSVAPAFTLTDATAGVGRDEESLAPFVNRIALGRPGTPEDIAPAVLFLASDDAAYVTGATLTVDGGTTASTGQPHVE